MRKLLKPRDWLLSLLTGYAVGNPPVIDFWVDTRSAICAGIMGGCLCAFVLIALNERDRQKKTAGRQPKRSGN